MQTVCLYLFLKSQHFSQHLTQNELITNSNCVTKHVRNGTFCVNVKVQNFLFLEFETKTFKIISISKLFIFDQSNSYI